MSLSSLSQAATPDEPVCVPSHACSIDLVHLSCITMGDKGLERDVLQAYSAQATIHRIALLSGDPERVRRAAHMLVGASRTVGAHHVAALAERCESVGPAGGGDLIAALDTATTFIASLND